MDTILYGAPKNQFKNRGTSMDTASLNNGALFALYAQVIDELNARHVIRSRNAPTGNYGEFLASVALGLRLKSSKGSDCLCEKDLKYEVKTVINAQRQASALRNMGEKHFDYLIGIVLDKQHRVVSGFQFPYEVVKMLMQDNSYQRANKIYLKDEYWSIDGVVNITQKLRAAEEEIFASSEGIKPKKEIAPDISLSK